MRVREREEGVNEKLREKEKRMSYTTSSVFMETRDPNWKDEKSSRCIIVLNERRVNV